MWGNFSVEVEGDESVEKPFDFVGFGDGCVAVDELPGMEGEASFFEEFAFGGVEFGLVRLVVAAAWEGEVGGAMGLLVVYDDDFVVMNSENSDGVGAFSHFKSGGGTVE